VGAAASGEVPERGAAEEVHVYENEFLALLPDDIREQVVAAQAIVREVPALAAEPLNCTNPEFLAALPPELQREVLQQERQQLERMRREAQVADGGEAVAEAVADGPAQMDLATVIATLDPNLRREVLLENSKWPHALRQPGKEGGVTPCVCAWRARDCR
jgi:hypothetical protein